jgi:hypothetical protein
MSRSITAAASPTASVAIQNMTGRAVFMSLQRVAAGRCPRGCGAPTCRESERGS